VLCESARTLLICGRFQGQGESGKRQSAFFGDLMPEDELIEVDLELVLAYTVVRAGEPLLKVADGPVGKRDGRLRALSQLRAKRLNPGYVWKPASVRPAKLLRPSV
jgi:hypothetical protein